MIIIYRDEFLQLVPSLKMVITYFYLIKKNKKKNTLV